MNKLIPEEMMSLMQTLPKSGDEIADYEELLKNLSIMAKSSNDKEAESGCFAF